MTNFYKRLKYYLTEMSESKAKMEQSIKSNLRELNEHLIKCILIQDTTHTLNHWSQEVYSQLSEVPKLKGSNKLPNERVLYHCTLGYFADSLMMKLDTYVENVFEQENIDIPEYDKQALYNCIINYYKWLIPILSTEGVIKNSQVKQQIKSLIQEYNKLSSRQKVGV